MLGEFIIETDKGFGLTNSDIHCHPIDLFPVNKFGTLTCAELITVYNIYCTGFLANLVPSLALKNFTHCKKRLISFKAYIVQSVVHTSIFGYVAVKAQSTPHTEPVLKLYTVGFKVCGEVIQAL